MTSVFTGRVPTFWHGHGVARRMTEQLTEGRETLVIADEAIPVPLLAGFSARSVRVDAASVDVTTVVTLAQKIVRRPPSIIVAVGGGSVLDASKIAALALAGGRVFDYAIGHASRFALTVLPDAPPPIDVVAVPTTLGTSSETNSVGILKNESGYRLIVGRTLRPRHALIDPHHLATLSPAAVREGVLEAFLRLAGSSTSPRRSARANSDAVVLGRALLDSATRDMASPEGRLRLARLSAATQRTAALRGQDPYSARHWYVANEVAFLLEVRKMAATAAVIAAVWRRICSGDSRWGDRESLEDFWAKAVAGTTLPLDPPSGITALIERWEIAPPPRPTARDISRIADATERSWGNRHPMLSALTADDFCDVLRDSCWNPEPVGNECRSSRSGSKGVI
ncbi:daptide-type RiPP biosynthesis dehydogenase [Microbacterium sp. SA39]|uniref:daptide-type RiPP biosynthesis dehydogenase n=1 Tax=Microbacterium sp. SA39 TaxID=1263625 RepID=UPI0005FA9384|nr:daptide-type RiPP biosynthesis dehydogenase [Microbacterium sp. SA39]KJQ54163.1 Phosphonoacetaldehyde reductase [Microbacterium sp. SA39]